MLELKHPHIIKLLDFFEERDAYFMVVEKMRGELGALMVCPCEASFPSWDEHFIYTLTSFQGVDDRTAETLSVLVYCVARRQFHMALLEL